MSDQLRDHSGDGGDVVEDALTRWSESFALLGDPARLDLLLRLRDAGPLSVGSLARSVNRSASAVSHSLRLLRAHRVVRAERIGRTVVYTLIDHEVVAVLSGVLADVRPALEPLPAPARTAS
jgi:ArsR family transcriptional regulator, lead/cadmium/zinc/bismuth-responsive transcriptional repressor